MFRPSIFDTSLARVEMQVLTDSISLSTFLISTYTKDNYISKLTMGPVKLRSLSLTPSIFPLIYPRPEFVHFLGYLLLRALIVNIHLIVV
jgi:hypothetical protein